MSKSWWESKTIWVAICEVVVGCVFTVGETLPDTTGVALIITGAVQAVLRLVTGKTIG